MNHELIASHNLQATHDILEALSGAKSSLETILDRQTDIFCLFGEGGQIIKGNRALSTVLKSSADTLYRLNLRSLFSAEAWLLFSNKMEILRKHRDKSNVSFELSIDGEACKAGESEDFLWTIARFDAVSSRRGQIYTIIGRNMTEIKRYQKRLGMIFSSVPLAIFQINRQKMIMQPYSAYTEIIFGREDLGNQLLSDVLAPMLTGMTSTERFGVDQLLASLGEEEFWYDIYKTHFPKTLKLDSNGKESWIGLNYSPIIRDGRVEEILVVAEDVTERVMARKAKEGRSFNEEMYGSIFFDAHQIDIRMVKTALCDIDQYLSKLTNLGVMPLSDRTQLMFPLHSLKGTARSIGLTYLTSLVHDTENSLLCKDVENLPLEQVLKTFKDQLPGLLEAWKITKDILLIVHRDQLDGIEDSTSALQGKINQLLETIERGDIVSLKGAVKQLLSDISKPIKSRLTTDLEQKIQAIANSTARKLGKEIGLDLTIETLTVDQDIFNALSEILTRVVSNAIDHGIEEPGTRQTYQKKPRGLIKVVIRKFQNGITCLIEDDGRGIDVDLVARRAVASGIITESQYKSMNDGDKKQLIFHPGLSTKEEGGEISGRGVGLSAADAAARSISLDDTGLKVESLPGRGTRFIFNCKVTTHA
ncbi:MAG TPA: ATP-binding protein [Oligoflexus sp.]|uniref:ATP-binding protein n=1 Tax=Oligoflexus sp. TaxID=1971216 RepID=UPI002D64BB92|nr:ATP-binding protein [Oligoflexus sp.]HYX33983.1 ATP-binding protein [Oligoflexus sp.]